MKIQWRFADGTISEVEVNEELGNYITASRREEASATHKHHRHCYSLDAIVYEGEEYGTGITPEDDMGTDAQNKRIYEAFAHLTEKQQARLLMLADGLSCHEIARREGTNFKTVYESIEAGKKKFKKFF
jgi:DNA-binding CsgD family transcriptional regulator